MFFEIGVLKILAIFSEKNLYWSCFFSHQKETPTQVLSLWILRNFSEQAFYRTPPVTASEGLHHGLFTGKFPGSTNLCQQLELEHLNQGRWLDVYVCFMVLLNVQYIMLNAFNKNSFRHPNSTCYLAEQKS